MNKWEFIGTSVWTSPSVLLNGSCHKKHEYIFYELLSEHFLRYEGFYEMNRVGHAHWDFPISVIKCVLS